MYYDIIIVIHYDPTTNIKYNVYSKNKKKGINFN